MLRSSKMYYQPEDSGTIIVRDRVDRRDVIQTDLSFSETIGDSDTDSLDSFDAKATVRENYEEEDEYIPPMLSESSPDTGRQILGPVSIYSVLKLNLTLLISLNESCPRLSSVLFVAAIFLADIQVFVVVT